MSPPPQSSRSSVSVRTFWVGLGLAFVLSLVAVPVLTVWALSALPEAAARTPGSGLPPSLVRWLQPHLSLDQGLNLKRFGASGDGVTDDTAAFYAAVAVARVRGVTLFVPAGTYLLNTNGPVRQADGTVAALEDFNGLTIQGVGRGSIIRTVPDEGGADVFQLNGVKNFTLRDVAIHSTLGAGGREGSNGVSITNGGENILIENCHFFTLPYRVYADGVSTDGGQAVTIQQAGDEGKVYRNIRILNNTADGGSYGFSYQGTGAGVKGAPIRGLVVRGNLFRNFYRGINVEVAATGSPVAPLAGMDVMIEGNTLLDCQQGLLVNGATGVNVVGNNVSSSFGPGNPGFTPKNALKFGAMMLSSHACNFIGNRIHAAQCDQFMYVGGGFAGEADTPSTNLIVSNNNFHGASDGYGIKSSSNPIYQSARGSVFAHNRFAGARLGGIDPLLFPAENGNVIVESSPAPGAAARANRLTLADIPVHPDNASAVAAGLKVGGIYRTGGDPDRLCVVH